MSIRFLLVGDLHLREGEQFEDVEQCLNFAADLADKHQVEAVLFAGDLFEGKSTPRERLILGRALARLAIAGRPFPASAYRNVLLIKGNHDQPQDLEVFGRYPWVDVFEHPGFRAVIEDNLAGKAVDVLCVPWPEKAFLAANGHAGEAGDQAGGVALAAMLRGMVATREHSERPLVVLAHLQVLGAISSSAQPLIGKAIEATLGDLQDLGAAAVVLGHVHRPQQLAPGIEYVGSLTVHDFGEQGEEKRVGILTIEDDGAASWEWIPVPCRRWVTIEARVVGIHPPEGTGFEISEMSADANELEGDEDFTGCNLRYRYVCTEQQQHLFDHAEVERRFAGAHTLKIVPQVERAERVRAAEVAAARSPEEKLAAWAAVTGTEITESHIEKLHELEAESV